MHNVKSAQSWFVPREVPQPAPSDNTMISDTNIGDYEIIKGGVLGTGAFATVWKGRSKKVG